MFDIESSNLERAIATPSVARSTATMSVSTLVSRLTGFARTWAMGYALGVTALADSFDIANTLPNMLFELLAGGILSSIFIPLFMEQMKKAGEEDAWRFASYILNIIVIVLGTLALVATIWPEPFVRSQTLSVSPERAELAVWLFRFFAVQVVFYGMSIIFTGVLNSYRHFFAPAVAPIFNNLVVTVTLLGFYVPLRDSNPKLALTALAIGTTLGVVVLAFSQIPSLIKLGVRYTPRIDWKHPALRSIGVKAAPTLIYVVTNLIGVTVRTNVAMATGPGGQAALRYAWQFYQLPYGIFAVALATAIFPELAERATSGDMASFKKIFARGLRATTVLVLPLGMLLASLATPVIMLYRAGRFTAQDVPIVANVLMWWAVGLIFYAAYMFVLKTFYSLQDTKTPMYTNIVTTALQIAMYVVLTNGVGAWRGLGIIGVPIADGVFFLLHVGALLVILRNRIGGLDGKAIGVTVAKVAVAATAGAAIARLALVLSGPLAGLPAGFVLQLLVAGAIGLAVAYALMAAMKVQELTMVTDRISRRLARSGGAS